MINLLVVLALITPVTGRSCPGLASPVDAEIVRPFAPVGRFGGHWGVDFGTTLGTPVGAADAGTVTFAGDVAGVLSVTVDHGGGLRTSYSYLSEISVGRGEGVAAGDTLGYSGLDHDLPAVHFSVRVGDLYRDPQPWLGCLRSPGPALALVPASAA
jgi:murein DD-endopeptidase MepM/ murein hydrolase activator NlpD